MTIIYFYILPPFDIIENAYIILHSAAMVLLLLRYILQMVAYFYPCNGRKLSVSEKKSLCVLQKIQKSSNNLAITSRIRNERSLCTTCCGDRTHIPWTNNHYSTFFYHNK